MAQATPPRVQIIQGSDTIPPVKNGTVNTVTVKLKIQLVGAYDTANADKNKVVFKIQQGTLSIKPIFVPIGTDSSITSYSVPASAWPNSNSPTQTEVELHLQVPGGAAIGNDEIGKIVIAGFDESFYSIVLSNNAEPIKTAYNPNKPFWVEIGSNFDFLEGLQANNPFFGVFFHKRDIRPFCKNASILENNAHKNVGVFAGVFESKTISTNQTEDFFSRLYFNNTSFIPGKPDSIRVFRDAGKYATKRSIRNIGLFFSPQLRLSKGSSNVDGLHFFVAGIVVQALDVEIVFAQAHAGECDAE